MWSSSNEVIPRVGPIALEKLASSVADHTPRAGNLPDGRQAAVAVVLRDVRETGQGPEVLVIERARHARDPWSGQMAFPGGKIDPEDDGARQAAERESGEELDLHLSAQEYIGQLDDILGLNAGIRPGVLLSPFVYCVDREVELVPNYEVANVIWTPLEYFLHPDYAVSMPHPREPGLHVAGVRVGSASNQVMWGLSYRVMQSLFGVAGVRIRNWRSGDERRGPD